MSQAYDVVTGGEGQSSVHGSRQKGNLVVCSTNAEGMGSKRGCHGHHHDSGRFGL